MDARVLSIDARDEDGHRDCLKIDGGPGRLNLEMFAELHLKGVYLPKLWSVQVTALQEYININGISAKKNPPQQQLHEQSPDKHPSPALPSLNRSHYGILLSGKESSPTLLPAFSNAFTKECCLKAWVTCSAIQLTWSTLNNPAVCHEVSSTDDTPDVSFTASSASEFDWTEATSKELEFQINNASDNLLKLGLDGEVFRTKAPRALVSLHNRIPADDSEEERVKALADKGFTLQMMFYTVGSTSISADKVFLSEEYKANNKRW